MGKDCSSTARANRNLNFEQMALDKQEETEGGA
jgi:hypothetical protein